MEAWIWIGFVVFILGMLALDLGVLNRKAHVPSIPEAFAWTGLWVSVTLAFNAFVYFAYEHHLLGIGERIGHATPGAQAAVDFLTGYIVEYSLSLDNIFIIALIFAYFQVPLKYQHRVLFWGVLGAIVLRGIMIGAGAALIARFHWVEYAFGVLLIITAAKMLVAGNDQVEPERNPLVRLARKLYPVTSRFEGERFFTRLDGRRAITPLFLVLLLVESTDVMFAVDSIPAIFAITQDPFLVYTSNVFAILGLRSLYFALAGVINKFRYLKFSLVFILAFVGAKMLLSGFFYIPTLVSLAFIVTVLAVGILASVIATQRETRLVSPLGGELAELSRLTLPRVRRVVLLLALAEVALLAGGMALLLTGPNWVILPAGAVIFATEFIWVRRLLRHVRQTQAQQTATAADQPTLQDRSTAQAADTLRRRPTIELVQSPRRE